MAAVRNQAIEFLRIVSALGIVWFHAGIVGSDIAGSGLIVFLVLSTFFLAGRRSDTPLLQLLLRFSAPWLVWVLIYGLFNMARGKPFLSFDNGVLAGLLAGSSIHLWFLPFMAFVVVAVVLFRRATSLHVLALAATAALLFTIVTFPFWYPRSWQAGAPFSQYLQVLPATLTGVALGAMRFPERNKIWGSAIIFLIALLVFLPADGAIAYTVGIIAVAVALAPPVQRRFSTLDFTPISGAMFGVYLIHPLAMYPMWRFINFAYGIPAVIAAFLLSLIVVLLTKRFTPQVSALVFGY